MVHDLTDCGIVGPTTYAIVLTALGVLWPGYNPVRQYMSELGAVDAPHAFVMNILGFQVLGISMARTTTSQEPKTVSSTTRSIGLTSALIHPKQQWAIHRPNEMLGEIGPVCNRLRHRSSKRLSFFWKEFLART